MAERKIAVLIDADNTPHGKLPLIVEELSAFGQLVVKRAYGDFSSDTLKNWKQPLNELAIQPQQQFAYTIGKNSTDTAMIIDAMDLLYEKRFDTFAIVSSDSDFTSLATRLGQAEIHVIGVGGAKTPVPFKNACADFITIENLGSEGAQAEDEPEQKAPTPTSTPSQPENRQQELWNLMHQTWQKCRDEAGWANLTEAGRYIKRIKSDFDPRTYGLDTLSDFFDSYKDRYETSMSGKGVFKFKLISKTDAKIMRQSK